MIVKRNERFSEFSVVLNIRGGQDVDWLELSKDKNQYVSKMVSLNFVTPGDLSLLLQNFEGISQNSVIKKNVRRFKIIEYIGQLEEGSENKKPHYNLVIKTNIKILVSSLVRELSKALYNVENCKSINVEPCEDYSALVSYCTKEDTRLVLENTIYYAPYVDYRVGLFLQSLNENVDLLKCITIQDYFKK